MSRESLYSTLWSSSRQKPYDHNRESEVARRRFARAEPAIAEAFSRVRTEGRPLRVLDFGCADGHTAEQILSQFTGSIEYYGCDIYELEETERRMKRAGFDVRVSGSGLDGMPEDWKAFDVILALSCFQYMDDLPGVLEKLVARLGEHGLFIGYFYDAGPLRRATDVFFRSTMDATPGDDVELIERLDPLAQLFGSLREATANIRIDVPVDVPELALKAGEVPLQQFLIDNVIFAWAPKGASLTRIRWALAEMFLTGEQTYISSEEIRVLMNAYSLQVTQVVSSPSGHLVLAQKD